MAFVPSTRANGSAIGDVIISPDAEPRAPASTVSAQQESDFFTEGGRQYHLQHNQQNLGWLGKFFGSNATAPTNIAGFVIVTSLIVLAISFFVSGNPEIAEVRKLLGTVVISALSFLFGAATKK
ncbi:hypothetical protein [Variovorax sp. V116]|uniref:hypothetical protein n=1 Tax=Variovorax sp. V116 TaxID=3065953 RepID=UPI0034E85DCB